ncbi:MAG: rhomboid family intramembrane serine protease [Chitinivibrionales bacterium]|nr:rhomboid family intramembrane serine protease [Chitinivibrionales bacterium]MBD3357592.1 rhomboid family intramembrane serine protease [Chitinivibrionales bacterium]
MFPIGDDNPTLSKPYVTYGLIGLNVAAWIFIQGFGSRAALIGSICDLGLTPGELLGTIPPGTETRLGPGVSCAIQAGSQWYTLLSSMFLHGGWFHLISNMWFLFVFGNNVEDGMGKIRFIIFYLICGLAAAAAQILANPDSAVPMVGASGAIGGVMGAYAIMYPRTPVHLLVILGFFITRVSVPAIVMLGYWFLLQVLGAIPSLSSDGAGVAFWAHVGGFLAGIALVFLFRNRKRLEEHHDVVERMHMV